MEKRLKCSLEHRLQTFSFSPIFSLKHLNFSHILETNILPCLSTAICRGKVTPGIIRGWSRGRGGRGGRGLVEVEAPEVAEEVDTGSRGRPYHRRGVGGEGGGQGRQTRSAGNLKVFFKTPTFFSFL